MWTRAVREWLFLPVTVGIFFPLFPGVYLPLLWEQSFCWKSPIALGYTRGHFSALVAMENDGYGNRGAGANLNTDDDVTITFLPLVDSERKLLHVHFLSAQEVSSVFLPWTISSSDLVPETAWGAFQVWFYLHCHLISECDCSNCWRYQLYFEIYLFKTAVWGTHQGT